MEVIILRGIPGSGKSTMQKSRWPGAMVVSADTFFVDASGKYNFDPTKLSEAHNQCLREFIAEMEYIHEVRNAQTGVELPDVVVDNTNSSLVEIAPYVAVAQAFNIPVRVITIVMDANTAHARNVHGVPLEVVEKMHEKLATDSADIPPWWKHETVLG